MNYEDPNVAKKFHFVERQKIQKLYQKGNMASVKSMYIRTAL